MGKHFGQQIWEAQIVADDRGYGSHHRLFDVLWRQRGLEPRLGFGAFSRTRRALAAYWRWSVHLGELDGLAQ